MGMEMTFELKPEVNKGVSHIPIRSEVSMGSSEALGRHVLGPGEWTSEAQDCGAWP